MSAQGQGGGYGQTSGYGGGYGMQQQQPQYGWGGGQQYGSYQQPQQGYRPNYGAWGGQQQQQPAQTMPAVQPLQPGNVSADATKLAGGDAGGGGPYSPGFTPGFAPQPAFGMDEGKGGARGVTVPGQPISTQPQPRYPMPTQGMGLLQRQQPYQQQPWNRFNQPLNNGQQGS